jgi:hypothetical protein
MSDKPPLAGSELKNSKDLLDEESVSQGPSNLNIAKLNNPSDYLDLKVQPKETSTSKVESLTRTTNSIGQGK